MKKQAEKLTGAATLREKAEEQLKLKQTNKDCLIQNRIC